MDERKRERFSPPALGGSSLLTVFAVLVLTVFALLSLSTVRADVRLGDAAAKAVSDYYAADVKAQETLARLRAGEVPEGVTAYREDARTFRYIYRVPVSDTQELRVEVCADPADGSCRVLRWQTAATEVWTYDDSLDVWDGEIVF